jgi:hypothetical protein
MVGGFLRVLRFLPPLLFRHDIAEILLKVALNTKNQSIKSIISFLLANREYDMFSFSLLKLHEALQFTGIKKEMNFIFSKNKVVLHVQLCWNLLFRHDIAEILLKVALNTKNQSIKSIISFLLANLYVTLVVR